MVARCPRRAERGNAISDLKPSGRVDIAVERVPIDLSAPPSFLLEVIARLLVLPEAASVRRERKRPLGQTPAAFRTDVRIDLCVLE
jgi:hypothetical protein